MTLKPLLCQLTNAKTLMTVMTNRDICGIYGIYHLFVNKRVLPLQKDVADGVIFSKDLFPFKKGVIPWHVSGYIYNAMGPLGRKQNDLTMRP